MLGPVAQRGGGSIGPPQFGGACSTRAMTAYGTTQSFDACKEKKIAID